MALLIDTCDTIINLTSYIIRDGSIYESKEKADANQPVYTFTGWAGHWLQPVIAEAIKDPEPRKKTAIMDHVYKKDDTVVINAVGYALDVKEYVKHCARVIERTRAMDIGLTSIEVQITTGYFEEFSGEYFSKLNDYTVDDIYDLLQTEVK